MLIILKLVLPLDNHYQLRFNHHMTIADNIHKIKQQLAQYERKYGVEEGSIQLLGSTKHQSIEILREAYHAGLTLFGENYLQEALNKMAALADLPIEWHFIGHIQSNKTNKIAENFNWVQSVDSKKIARRLNDHRPAHMPPLNICIEVNVSHETTKFGVDVNIHDVVELAKFCDSLPNLTLRGLMTIPAYYEDLHRQREEFHKLFLLWDRIREEGIPLDVLSMGMSSDFEAAVAEGSTMIRIGTAIFGERQKAV